MVCLGHACAETLQSLGAQDVGGCQGERMVVGQLLKIHCRCGAGARSRRPEMLWVVQTPWFSQESGLMLFVEEALVRCPSCPAGATYPWLLVPHRGLCDTSSCRWMKP